MSDKVLRKGRIFHIKWADNFPRPIFLEHQLIIRAISPKETSSWFLIWFLPLNPQKCISEKVPSNISKAMNDEMPLLIRVLTLYLQKKKSEWNKISQTE